MTSRHNYSNSAAAAKAVRAVPTTTKDETVANVVAMVHSLADTYETIDYVYILDGSQLAGVVSFHELLQAQDTNRLADIMISPVVSVSAHSDQETVAHLALAQNIKAVPVVNTEGDFIGAIPADTILQVLRDEHTEDILKYAGLTTRREETPDLLLRAPVTQQIQSRLPWLILGLGGGVAAAVIVEQFAYTIEAEVALAAFIPAIVYIADAVGSQTQMVFIRSLTLNPSLAIGRLLVRESAIASVVGLILGGILFLISYWWLASLTISSILALAIIGTVYFSVLVAILLPVTFVRLRFDPAIASGPLATVVRDLSSLCIYFAIAWSLL